MTLTSAPVSTRKHKLEFRSLRKNRRLLERPVVLVAISDWEAHFPTLHKVDGTCMHLGQISGGTNTHLTMD